MHGKRDAMGEKCKAKTLRTSPTFNATLTHTHTNTHNLFWARGSWFPYVYRFSCKQ